MNPDYVDRDTNYFTFKSVLPKIPGSSLLDPNDPNYEEEQDCPYIKEDDKEIAFIASCTPEEYWKKYGSKLP